jgi:hypothetical protein
MPPEKVKRVSPETIRGIFNHSQCSVSISKGLLVPQLLKDTMLQNPNLKGEPQGTRSQTIRYSDLAGQWVVVIHQYLRPDGSLGASGKPDPKRLRINDTVFLSTDG